jgi:hypothetical protein
MIDSMGPLFTHSPPAEQPSFREKNETIVYGNLLPCPHCGSKDVELCGKKHPDGYSWVQCYGCGAKTQKWDRFDKSVGMWNRRVINTEQPRKVVSVPEGYALVPLSATKEMCVAWESAPLNEDGDAELQGAYAAMLSAAPSPAVVQPVVTDLKLNRSIETWEKCDPAAMAKQSEAAIMFAFQDARADILKLNEAINKAEGSE